MDFSKVIAALEKGVSFVEEIAPTLAELTPYGNAAGVAVKAIEAITETVQNIEERVAEGTIVLHSTDQAQVKALAQRLHDVNDGLSKQVDDS